VPVQAAIVAPAPVPAVQQAIVAPVAVPQPVVPRNEISSVALPPMNGETSVMGGPAAANPAD
jgi:hypothetical protein